MAFTRDFVAAPADIDELGHVNNAVWVQWIQDVAVAHWHAQATAQQHEATIWVVIRHEVDYLRALKVGETAHARTWVADRPKGAKFDRLMEFKDGQGRTLVRARTTWAMLDRATGRPLRVPQDVADRFVEPA